MPKASAFCAAIDIRQAAAAGGPGHCKPLDEGVSMNEEAKPAAQYDDTVVRQFTLMAVVWGVVGMLVGLFIAAQLACRNSTSAFRGSVTDGCVRCTPTR